MIKKILLCLLLTGITAVSALSAQNFLDNEFQKAGQEFEKQAAAAMDAGEYDKATEYANLASESYRKSREFADGQSLKFKAANSINLAQQAIDLTANTARAKAAPSQVAEAKDLLKQARNLYAAGTWTDSKDKADQSLGLINSLAEVTTITTTNGDQITLPRYYVVVRRPSNTDCFWNIAKMPVVYGNPHLWNRLYQANKNKLKNPDNPNLLHPGTVLEIPPLKDEKREGTYDPTKRYQNMP